MVAISVTRPLALDGAELFEDECADLGLRSSSSGSASPAHWPRRDGVPPTQSKE